MSKVLVRCRGVPHMGPGSVPYTCNRDASVSQPVVVRMPVFPMIKGWVPIPTIRWSSRKPMGIWMVRQPGTTPSPTPGPTDDPTPGPHSPSDTAIHKQIQPLIQLPVRHRIPHRIRYQILHRIPPNQPKTIVIKIWSMLPNWAIFHH